MPKITRPLITLPGAARHGAVVSNADQMHSELLVVLRERTARDGVTATINDCLRHTGRSTGKPHMSAPETLLLCQRLTLALPDGPRDILDNPGELHDCHVALCDLAKTFGAFRTPNHLPMPGMYGFLKQAASSQKQFADADDANEEHQKYRAVTSLLDWQLNAISAFTDDLSMQQHAPVDRLRAITLGYSLENETRYSGFVQEQLRLNAGL